MTTSNTAPDAHCPHLHQDYPGTPINKCLDCGEPPPDAPPPRTPNRMRIDTQLLNEKLKDAEFGEQEMRVIQILISQCLTPDIAARSEGEAADLIDRGAARLAINNLAVVIGPMHCAGYEERSSYNSAVYKALDAIEALPSPSAPADEVERAWAELREMSEVGAATIHIAIDRRTRYFRITIWPRDGEQSEFEVEGATLTEAMASVREWQAKEKK